MRQLPSVTLLALDTRDPDAAVVGMQKSMAAIQFADAVLLTYADYECKDARITVKAIPPVRNIEDYSRFMIKALGQYFNTSHVLIAQWDGFVVNPDVWDDEFLTYDYIGAPWKNHRHAVGNGGFCLRSRKLIDALQDSEVKFFDPEDFAICDRYHDLLVSRYGIRFAPIDVARKFSCETYKPPSPSFGVHGIGSVHWVVSDQVHLEFLKWVPVPVLLGSTGRTLAKDCIDTGKWLSAQYILAIRAEHGALSKKMDALKLKLKLALKLSRKREVEPITSVYEIGVGISQRQGLGQCLHNVFKKYVQRGLVLLLSGQYFLQKNAVPAGAKTVLWFYDWHMLGDCELSPSQAQRIGQNYQLDICVPTGPLDVFEANPLFRHVYRSVDLCSSDYDFVILNDINSRSIRLKINRFRKKPWAVLVDERGSRQYRQPDYVSQRVQQIFGGGIA
jgi:hypothetical protein